MKNKSYDVIIVGAGLAGLSAARHLSLAGKDTLVLEARSRVGGRVFTKFQGGIPIDLGAQWIMPGQTHLLELIQSFGLETFQNPISGKHILAINHRMKSYSGPIPKMGFPSSINLKNLVRKIDAQSGKINIDAPWTSAPAQKLDHQKFSDFINKRSWFPSTKKFLNIGLETVLGCHTSEISTLQALFYLKSGGHLASLLKLAGSSQSIRLAEGMQTLTIKMANEVNVLLHHPVRAVKHFKGGVDVSGEGFSYKARKIIVALPPWLSRKITFRPEITNDKKGLWEAMPTGKVLKCYAIYDHPFWKQQGCSGHALADEKHPMQAIFDNASHHHPHGIIMGVSIGKRAEQLMHMPFSEREDKITETLKYYFGSKAKNVITYMDKSWFEDVWTEGGFAGFRKPGAWTKFQDVLVKPTGRIHWAGSETSSIWNGRMEGAVISGIRAASEILTDVP